jgi:hypothetical protein
MADLDSQKLVCGDVIFGFNLLKIADTNIFTKEVTGNGAATFDNANGTITLNTTTNGNDIMILETDKIALSGLPRIGIFRINNFVVSGSTAQMYFGFWSIDTTTHYAIVATTDGGSNWNFITNDGTASETTAITAPTANDVFIIYATSTRCSLFKNDTHIATHTTRVPSQAIGHIVEIVNVSASEGAGNQITLGFMS